MWKRFKDLLCKLMSVKILIATIITALCIYGLSMEQLYLLSGVWAIALGSREVQKFLSLKKSD
jgi:hypothetical protein